MGVNHWLLFNRTNMISVFLPDVYHLVKYRTFCLSNLVQCVLVIYLLSSSVQTEGNWIRVKTWNKGLRESDDVLHRRWCRYDEKRHVKVELIPWLNRDKMGLETIKIMFFRVYHWHYPSKPLTSSVFLPRGFYRCRIRDLRHLYNGTYRLPWNV